MAYIHTDFMRGVVQPDKKVVHHINRQSELSEQYPLNPLTFSRAPE
jgi:hypothetical protein